MAEPTREFSFAEAQILIPQVRDRVDIIVRLRADLADLTLNLHHDAESASGGVPEVKALEAHLNEAVAWFAVQDIEIKGIAPVLIDFPTNIGGHSAQYCWLEGETELGWYHRTELGFAGRRRLA